MKTRKPRQSKRALYELTAAQAAKNVKAVKKVLAANPTVLPRVDQETLNQAWNDVLHGVDTGRQMAGGTSGMPRTTLPNVTLDFAQEAFGVFPSNETAAVYMHKLMQYEEADMIGDDTWLDGLASIRDYLWKSRKVAR